MPMMTSVYWNSSPYVTIRQPPFPESGGKKLPPMEGTPAYRFWQRQGNIITAFDKMQHKTPSPDVAGQAAGGGGVYFSTLCERRRTAVPGAAEQAAHQASGSGKRGTSISTILPVRQKRKSHPLHRTCGEILKRGAFSSALLSAFLSPISLCAQRIGAAGGTGEGQAINHNQPNTESTRGDI